MNNDRKSARGGVRSGRRSGRSQGIRLGWAEIAAVVIVVFCLGFVLGRFTITSGEYEGLGEPAEKPLNEYDSSSFYYTDDGRLHYDDDTYTSLQVIDVSYAQKDIDWEKVAADGIDMAIVRLGYRGYSSGYLNLDAYYDANMKGAKKAGIKTGVYFFSQAVSVEEAREEAKFVLKNIKGYKVKGPIAFDMEPIEGADRITHLTVEEKTAIADAFCSYLKKKGYDAMVYGNPHWLSGDVDLSLLTKHPVWLAHYTKMTDWAYWYSMWQYTSKGKVSGIEGKVDMNVMLVKK